MGQIIKNDIFENIGVQIVVKEKTNPTIKSNRLWKGGSVGISIYEKGAGIISENDVFQHTYSGIKLASGATAVVENNKIHDISSMVFGLQKEQKEWCRRIRSTTQTPSLNPLKMLRKHTVTCDNIIK